MTRDQTIASLLVLQGLLTVSNCEGDWVQRCFTLDPELPRESCIERHGDTVCSSDLGKRSGITSIKSVGV